MTHQQVTLNLCECIEHHTDKNQQRCSSKELRESVLYIPLFKNRKLVYALSLVLGGIGFISIYFVHNQYALFLSFLLIGCAWAAMLALPFTILTNALTGGHMGTYLGLFNGTICVPQIVAAALGGTILSLMTPTGGLSPEINMMVIAGIMLLLGACAVFIIKEKE